MLPSPTPPLLAYAVLGQITRHETLAPISMMNATVPHLPVLLNTHGCLTDALKAARAYVENGTGRNAYVMALHTTVRAEVQFIEVASEPHSDTSV